MKKILFIICTIFLICGCGCRHKDGEHIPNDTIKCVVINKDKHVFYDVVFNASQFKYDITILNPNTKNKVTIDNSNLFHKCDVNDTMLQVVHYCPHYYVELTLNK